MSPMIAATYSKRIELKSYLRTNLSGEQKII